MLQRCQWEPAKLELKSRHLLKLVLPGFAGGIHMEIPFHVLVGRVRKPRVLLIAGVHGDEYESVAALHDVVKGIDPERLRGTLTIVPVANPQAFYAGTRRNPVDLGDLNRAFPGNPNGTITERVADLLFQNLVLCNDAVLSMHCWSKEATVVPYVECAADQTSVGRKSAALAHALGLEFVHPYIWHPGLLVASAIHRGIPAVEPEVGGMGMVTPYGQGSYRNIVYRFLHHMKLLDSHAYQTDPPHPNPKTISHSDCRANHAGLFRSRVSAGTAVEDGSILGTIHGLAGECLEEIRAPRAGVVGNLRTFASVQPGDLLVQLFWQIKELIVSKRTRHNE
ncbi:MAG: succinylglutamate desuccinylase/aspartoacylase family protein [Terriglobia bacterium]|jgi:predicted deacylase